MNAAANPQKPTPAPRSRYPERRRHPTREDIIWAFTIAEVVRAAEA